MNNLITDCTLPVIAAEIKMIKHQTEKILLVGAIEIGRRLKEAKDLLPYGEWGKCLDPMKMIQKNPSLHVNLDSFLIPEDYVRNDGNSTHVRDLLKAGKSVRYLVPEPMYFYYVCK